MVLREHAMTIISSKEQHEKKKNRKICVISEGNLKNKYLKDKKYRKARDHCHYKIEYRGAGNSICNSKYKVPKKML